MTNLVAEQAIVWKLNPTEAAGKGSAAEVSAQGSGKESLPSVGLLHREGIACYLWAPAQSLVFFLLAAG